MCVYISGSPVRCVNRARRWMKRNMCGRSWDPPATELSGYNPIYMCICMYTCRHGTGSPCQGHVRYVQAPSLCRLSLAERGLTPSGKGATVGADIAVTRLYRSLL